MYIYIYIRKSKSTNTEPCGTPHANVDLLDLKPLMDTYRFLLHR